MPSGSDFKYSTGDTTLWKTKYYALVDYLLSVGGSVADIEAFLAENSSFSPGTAPTALASLNAVTATTADNLEYQISHGTPYESLTANLWFLVRMPTANAGAMTLKVDDLPAKDVYVGGNPTAGGELAAGGVYVLSYNSGADRFEVVGPRGRTPTLQVFTASGTWNRPTGCRAAFVEVHGAGGGGGHESSGNGSAGGTSSWSDGVNTLSASGGGGGPSGGSDVAGGAAGIGTGGTINLGGGRGGNSNTSMSTTNALEGLGGSGAMRSGPQTPSQGSGQYGVGIGGGGAGDTDGSRCGAGGGGGGYTAKMIDVTGIASATVVVGAGGAGGQSGINGGAPGMVMVTEFY